MDKDIVKVINVWIDGKPFHIRRPVNYCDRQIAFDAVIRWHKANGRSRGKELLFRISAITGAKNEGELLDHLKFRARAKFKTWERKIPATILEILGGEV